MPASPLTNESWPGLPLLQCDMDQGLYRISVDVPVLILRDDPGTIVEVAGEDGRSVKFRQAPFRFDLFTTGISMDAVSDRAGTKSLVVALPSGWLPAYAWGPDGPVLRSRFQFADRELWRLVWRLRAHHLNGEPLGSPYSVAVSRTIVDRLLGLQIDIDNRMLDTTGLDPEARRHLEMLVDTNLHAPPSLAAMASIVGMSAGRFAREFKATLGATPHQYVQQRRLAAARELLTSTDASVAQIALEVGFANHAHFSTAFRELMGLTPSAYRRCKGQLQ